MEIEGQESLFIEFSPEVVSEESEEISSFVKQVEGSFPLVIIVDSIGHLILSKENRRFTVTGVQGSEIFALNVVLEIVSDDMNLMESSPESFGGGQVAAITDTENILVSSVLKSFVVNIQHVVGFSGGESGGNKVFVRSAGHHLIKVVVISSFSSSSFGVLKNSSLGFFINFD